MDSTGYVSQLLEEKKAKFLEYEEATRAMLTCDADSVEHYITLRGSLANEIDQINEQIGRASDEAANGNLLLDTAMTRVNFEHIPPEYKPIFEEAQAVGSVAFRIQELDKQVMERLAQLREEAREGIRQNQNLPKIKKYLTDLASPQDEQSLTSGKA